MRTSNPAARQGTSYSLHNKHCNLIISVRGSAGEMLPYLAQALIRVWEQFNPQNCPRQTLKNVHSLAEEAADQVFQRELTEFSDKSDSSGPHKTSEIAETGPLDNQGE